jgi:hypothetical protein
VGLPNNQRKQIQNHGKGSITHGEQAIASDVSYLCESSANDFFEPTFIRKLVDESTSGDKDNGSS